MKRSMYKITLVLCLFSGLVYAKRGEVNKDKKITKTFEVTASTKLNIENQYGEVHVNTWDKKEIVIEIEINAVAKTDARAQELLDRITISDIRTGENIFMKTNIKSSNSSISINGGKEQFEIDYTINMPENNPLNVSNKFGGVYLADFSGSLNLNVAYGSLQAENIKGGDKMIKISFGSAAITSIESGRIEASYSKLNIDKAGNIEVKNMFGGTEIDKVDNLKIDQQYGSLEISSVDQISGKVAFSNVSIDNLLKSLDLNLKYASRAELGKINSSVELIKVNANFSNLYFEIEDGASMNFDMNFKFGDFKSDDNPQISSLKTSKTSDSNSSSYQGKLGRGKGMMILSVNYGNVYF
jgi:hypothetical protein